MNKQFALKFDTPFETPRIVRQHDDSISFIDAAFGTEIKLSRLEFGTVVSYALQNGFVNVVGANVAIHHGENYPRPHVEGDIIRQPQPEKEVLICDYCIKSPSACGHKPLNPRNCGGKDGEMESGFVPRR